MMTIQFTVPGEPRGKGRPRFTRSGHAYTDQKTRDYEKHIANEYGRQMGPCTFPAESPLAVLVTAYFPIPKSASKKHREQMKSGDLKPGKKPDGDNILKIILDGLQGIAFADDKMVTNAQIVKRYSDDPRVEVWIKEELE